jgi:hypothetical protein
MKKLKVLLNFVKKPVTKKITLYRYVINRLTDHPLFTHPDIELEELISLTNKLESDYIASRSGEHEKIALMHETRDITDNAFRVVARYVDRIANGSEADILSSGFSISQKTGSYNKPPIWIKQKGNEVIFCCKAIPHARAYVWQYAIGNLPDDDSGWLFAGGSTRVMYGIKGLESGIFLWVRVAPITPKEFGPWSDPIKKVVG